MQSCRKRGKRPRNVPVHGVWVYPYSSSGWHAQHTDKIRTAGHSKDLLKSFGEQDGTVPWGVVSGVFFLTIFRFKVTVGHQFCPLESMLLQSHPEAYSLSSSEHSLWNNGLWYKWEKWQLRRGRKFVRVSHMRLRMRLSSGCKWGLQWCSGKGRDTKIAGRHLIKALFYCGLSFSGNMRFCTHTCLILTRSVSPGSLSCQSHPRCLWKYHSKWNARAAGASAEGGLFDLLAEWKHWVAVGKEDYLVQLEMKTKCFCLCKVNRVSVICVCGIFLCLACMLQKFNPIRVKHNCDGSHDRIMYLTMSQWLTVFSKIWESCFKPFLCLRVHLPAARRVQLPCYSIFQRSCTI